MVKTEFHNGSAYAKIAEASYDGEGNRVRLVAWAAGVPFTTTYTYQLVEQVRILQAKSGTNTTAYLYGPNPIGEFGTQSVYYLADGSGSVRQLADVQGYVVLSRWYEPFGQVLAQKGTAVATYAYLGAQLDRVTGLLYINGRYYDPVTGRFLTPSGGANPYLPLQISGSLLGPLAILSAMAQRNRKRRKVAQRLLVVLALFVVAGMLTGCPPIPPPPPPTQPPSPPSPTQPPTQTPGRRTPSPVPATPGSSRTPTLTPTCTPTATPTPWETQYGIAIARAAQQLLNNRSNYYIWGGGGRDGVDENYRDPPPRRPPHEDDIWWGYGKKVVLYDRIGKRIPIVCADIVSISYASAGLDLEKTYPAWNAGGAKGKDSTSSRDVWMLHVLLRDHHQEHQWGDGTMPELGDMVLMHNYAHSGIISRKLGNDASKISVINASYPNDVIEEISLAEWNARTGGNAYFGHPNR